MAPSEHSNIDFNVMLDKILEFSERNLDIQKEFISKVYELKNRLESSERDHRDISSDTKSILTGINNIYDKMKITPNEHLLQLLEEISESNDAITAELKAVSATRPLCETYHKDSAKVESKVDLLTSKVAEISDVFGMVKNLMGVISVLFIVGQILIAIYFSVQRHADVKVIVDTVIKEIQSNDIKVGEGK